MNTNNFRPFRLLFLKIINFLHRSFIQIDCFGQKQTCLTIKSKDPKYIKYTYKALTAPFLNNQLAIMNGEIYLHHPTGKAFSLKREFKRHMALRKLAAKSYEQGSIPNRLWSSIKEVFKAPYR